MLHVFPLMHGIHMYPILIISWFLETKSYYIINLKKFHVTNILYPICLLMYFVNSKKVSPLGFKYGVHVTLMKQVL
jgi:hypothetical protein